MKLRTCIILARKLPPVFFAPMSSKDTRHLSGAAGACRTHHGRALCNDLFQHVAATLGMQSHFFLRWPTSVQELWSCTSAAHVEDTPTSSAQVPRSCSWPGSALQIAKDLGIGSLYSRGGLGKEARRGRLCSNTARWNNCVVI